MSRSAESKPSTGPPTTLGLVVSHSLAPCEANCSTWRSAAPSTSQRHGLMPHFSLTNRQNRGTASLPGREISSSCPLWEVCTTRTSPRLTARLELDEQTSMTSTAEAAASSTIRATQRSCIEVFATRRSAPPHFRTLSTTSTNGSSLGHPSSAYQSRTSSQERPRNGGMWPSFNTPWRTISLQPPLRARSGRRCGR